MIQCLILVLALLRQDFHDVAADDFVTQRDHLAVYFRADALVPHFGVYRVRKVHRSCASWQLQHAAFRRERIDFDRSEIHFQRG